MLWILLAILTAIWTYIPPKNHRNVKELTLPLNMATTPAIQKLSYSSAKLKQIRDLMVRKIPNYYDIRRIKELKINRRRIRLQKYRCVEDRKVNLANLSCLPKDNKAILNSKNMSFAMVNTRSIKQFKQSLNMILELLVRENYSNSITISSTQFPTLVKRGGQINANTRTELDVKILHLDPISGCESGLWRIINGKTTITLLGVYHPPKLVPSLFIDNFLDEVEHLIITHSNLLLSGDFNLHINDFSDADATYFTEALSALGLYQYVDKPTHNKGNILDLIFFEDQDNIKITKCVPIDFVSDHRMVVCELNAKKEYPVKNTVTLHKLDCDASALINSNYNDTDIMGENDLDSAISAYISEAQNIMDLIYKTKESKIATHKKVHWFNDEVYCQRKVVRNGERCWLKYSEDHQWLAYKRE